MVELKDLKEDFIGFFKPGIEVSYSLIKAYRFCPYKYKLIYKDRRHIKHTPQLSMGLSIHKALEDFYNKDKLVFDELMESYNRCWVNEGFSSPIETYEFFEKGKEMLERFWQSNKNSKSKVLHVEKSFRFQLGRNYVRGIIDRIDLTEDSKYELIDYKTHAKPWNQESIDNDLQLTIYYLACREALGIKIDTLSFYFIAQNKKVETSRSDSQIEEAIDIIDKTTLSILKEDFTPKTSSCQMCDFSDSCPKSSVKNGENKE